MSLVMPQLIECIAKKLIVATCSPLYPWFVNFVSGCSMKMFSKFVLLFCMSISVVALGDDLITADVKGIKDPPETKRIEGSVLVLGEEKAFDEHTIALQRVEFDYGTQGYKPWNKIVAEGARSTAFYRMPKDVSTLEPLRSYQEELTGQGFEVLYQGKSEELDNGYGRFMEQVYGKKIGAPLMEYIFPSADDFRYIALRKNRDDGSQVYFTGLFMKVPSSWGSKFGNPGDVLGRIDVLQTKALNKRLVLVKAEEMAQQIGSNGKVALYGILFDFNKADIKPESNETLEQVAKYLSDNPTKKLVVTGHTDNVGNFEFNRDLSQRRAQAVVEYLVSKHSIAKDRLLAFGASFASPVASNASEDGKAKNRRVELVEF